MGFPCDGMELFFMQLYGGFGYDGSFCGAYLGLATGLPQAGNPPYAITDFLAFYPQFFGPPASVSGTVTSGSSQITGVASLTGITAGQLVTGPFPSGTVVASASGSTITVSNNATANGASVAIFTGAPIPLAVIQAYLNLAYASLMSSRWREWWPIAMALYIAHFLTLYAQSAGSITSDAGQIAAAGLEKGIATSQSAGPVSYSQQPLTGLESWGAWTKTTFGTQLVSQAQVVGAGMIYIR